MAGPNSVLEYLFTGNFISLFGFFDLAFNKFDKIGSNSLWEKRPPQKCREEQYFDDGTKTALEIWVDFVEFVKCELE